MSPPPPRQKKEVNIILHNPYVQQMFLWLFSENSSFDLDHWHSTTAAELSWQPSLSLVGGSHMKPSVTILSSASTPCYTGCCIQSEGVNGGSCSCTNLIYSVIVSWGWFKGHADGIEANGYIWAGSWGSTPTLFFEGHPGILPHRISILV